MSDKPESFSNKHENEIKIVPENISSNKQKQTNTNDILAEFDPLHEGNSIQECNLNSVEQNLDKSIVHENDQIHASSKVDHQFEMIETPTQNLSIVDHESNKENINLELKDHQESIKELPETGIKPFSTFNETVEQASEASETILPLTTTTTASPSLTESDSVGNLAQEYQLKWIIWKGGERYPIVTQNSNGPCPLLAIINVLLLRKSITIPPMYELITASQLMDFLCDSILNSVPPNIADEERANYEQNFQDAMSVLPKLATGLDVNVKFSGVDQFEYTQESIIFDLLNIPLVHGWLIDPADCELHRIIGNSSYNQLIDRIISSKGTNGDCSSSEMMLAEEFLNNSASQLTHYGLFQLERFIKEDELAIFFRNNHFITLYKRNNQLYQLATDQGFLSEPNVVWETLNSIEGNTYFVDSNFVLVPPKTDNFPDLATMDMSNQIDQDHLLALSLAREQEINASQEQTGQNSSTTILSDEEYARQLQEEEDKAHRLLQQQQQQQQHKQPRSSSRQQHHSHRPDSAASSSYASQTHNRSNNSNTQQNFNTNQRNNSQTGHSSMDESSNRTSLRNSRQSPSPSERSSRSSKCIIS